MLQSISPVDGRYAGKTKELQNYFSEFALIKYRVKVEVEYLIQLSEWIDELDLTEQNISDIRSIHTSFSLEDAQYIKDTEKVTNHDVKAVEYFIKDKMAGIGLDEYLEFVHFGLTSQDINNTALPMMIQEAVSEVLLPNLEKCITFISESAKSWWHIPILARTHGQPASPTTLGKEMMVFVDRLQHQVHQIKEVKLRAKFGGATGQFNAHIAAYPQHDWVEFANKLIHGLGLDRSQWTTQIGHYDDHSEMFDAWARVNTILIDFCRDIWTYISINYFGQKTVANEVGSSAMPHKVNPIDFENAEGNLSFSHALLQYFSQKLPISRLQRDLTDSTVTRNIGLPFAHILIAMKSLEKGWNKLKLNEAVMDKDLEENWAVVSEAIQNILRREKYPKPYEALKALTRGKAHITRQNIQEFIDELNISDEVKDEMRAISPQNYLGILKAN